jgi:hypothetical protein
MTTEMQKREAIEKYGGKRKPESERAKIPTFVDVIKQNNVTNLNNSGL